MSEHRWPPQPGDWVKVDGWDELATVACLGVTHKTVRVKKIGEDWGTWVCVSDLSPTEPPQTIEQFGRTYRLDEGWQPIETAPKDGTRVLLWVCDFGRWLCVCGSWDNDRHATKPKPYWTHDNARSNGIRDTRANQPTHWMPLPPPPAMKEPTP